MNTLDIGIDGYNLAMPNGTGVKTYAANLATVLRRTGHRLSGIYGIDTGPDPELREVLFFDRLGRPEADLTRSQRRRKGFRRNLTARMTWREVPAAEVPLTGRVDKAPLGDGFPTFDRLFSGADLFDRAHRYFRFHGRLMPVRVAHPPAIMHWTYPVPLRMVGSRNIYTIHDVVPLKLPYATLDDKAAYRRLLRQCEAEAALLCTVSERSVRDILAEFVWDESRVVNTYQCAILPESFIDGDPEADARIVGNTFGLPHRGYFLYFAAIEPKKNVARMLESYLALGTDTPLVLVSGRGWQGEAELSLLSTPQGDRTELERLATRVVRLDHLSRALLLRLVRGARAVLFPSLYEGFGLPVLETMQLGTPVLTSTAGALPEVAGDGALLVDPYDTIAMSAGIKALDEDADLRARIGAAGLRQAARFSPDAYAARLDGLYGQALRNSL